jgi:hypothetical protein
MELTKHLLLHRYTLPEQMPLQGGHTPKHFPLESPFVDTSDWTSHCLLMRLREPQDGADSTSVDT